MASDHLQCPICHSYRVHRRGRRGAKTRMTCLRCQRNFQSSYDYSLADPTTKVRPCRKEFDVLPDARTILSLCDFTGNWSLPYREAGYRVIQVDAKTTGDLRLLEHPGRVHGILAAPPCTLFAVSGRASWKDRTDEDLRQALSVVDACLRLVATCDPEWWALENPVGRLKTYLGDAAFFFDPCDFGDPYTKKTGLKRAEIENFLRMAIDGNPS